MFSLVRFGRSARRLPKALQFQPFGPTTVSQNLYSTDLLTTNSTITTFIRNKIWTSDYHPVETSEEALHDKLFRALDRHIANDANKVALKDGLNPNHQVTYQELKEQGNATACYLSSIGFQHGDMAAIVLPNCIEFAVTLLGVMKCGGAVTAANPLYTDHEIKMQLLDSKSKIVVTHELLLQNVLEASKSCSDVKTIICVRATENALPPGVVDFRDVLQAKGPQPTYTASPSDLAFVPYSSGTTGAPKGVMLSNQNLGTMIEVITSHISRQMLPAIRGDNKDEFLSDYTRILQLPFFHVYGFILLSHSLMEGMPGVILAKFDAINYLTNVQNHLVRCLEVVPPIVLLLANHPVVDKFDLSSVNVLISGAAPCGKELADAFSRRFPKVQMNQGYGLSETVMSCHLPSCESEHFDTVGKPSATFEMKIVDVETNEELGPNEKGEICVRGPCVMQGYLNRPKESSECLIDGWLHTGDVGYANEEGETFIVDRKKELIKVKAMQVAPAELEDVLLTNPHVADAAVIGIPDPQTGEAPRAFVVRKDPSITEQDIAKYIEGRLSKHKWLTGGVKFVDEIPKSPSGKILRRILRDMDSQQKV